MHASQPEPLDSEGELRRGHPGASARAEFERRRQVEDDRRQRVFGRFLAPIVKLVAGESAPTANWDRGGRSEERVGLSLSRAVGLDGVVLHDRAIPGRRSNIDHIAIVPSGVWVIDTKSHAGRVQQRDLGGWFVAHPALFVDGRNRSTLIDDVLAQSDLLEPHLPADVPLRAALCFADAEWGLLGRPFSIDSVLITWEHKLAAALTEPGPLSVDTIRRVSLRLGAAFPPYAPWGTSQSPTGA